MTALTKDQEERETKASIEGFLIGLFCGVMISLFITFVSDLHGLERKIAIGAMVTATIFVLFGRRRTATKREGT